MVFHEVTPTTSTSTHDLNDRNSRVSFSRPQSSVQIISPTITQPRPLFLYGTLRAIPLLAWALTGDATKTDFARNITRNAYVKGYARYTISGKDYPAVVKTDSDDSACVDGLLLLPQNRSQRAKLDDFEGETYKVEPAVVTVTDEGLEKQVHADIYVWNGGPEIVSKECWDLGTFERERLGDWLELFGGMELIGHDSDDNHI